jgi:putative FmdB family regulatory protein
MPTYDYQCDACEHRFEEFQSMKDEPLRKCPACKKNKLRRLIGGGAAILFKGSGFYLTDYRSESYKQAAKADAEASKSSSSTSDSNGKASTGRTQTKAAT